MARSSRPIPGARPFWPGPRRGLECAGSFYNQTLALAALDLSGHALPPQPRIAVVGTPCEVEAIRAMQARSWTWGASQVDAVALTVALLCTKSFNYEKLMVTEVQRRRGIPLEQVGKVDVIHGRMIVEDTDGQVLVDEPVRDFHGAALKGCDECADFLGHAADLSVGSVGSEDGWSSVLVRTPTGRVAFERVRDRLELRDLDHEEACTSSTRSTQDRPPQPAAAVRPVGTVVHRLRRPRRPVHRHRPGPGGPRPMTEAAPAPSLALPEEPVELRRRTRALIEQDPERGAAVIDAGPWIADPLWERWGPDLERAGMDRDRFGEIVTGYRRTVLWVMASGPGPSPLRPARPVQRPSPPTRRNAND